MIWQERVKRTRRRIRDSSIVTENDILAPWISKNNGDYNLVILFRLKLGGPNLARNHHGVRHQDPWLTLTVTERRRHIDLIRYRHKTRIIPFYRKKIGNWKNARGYYGVLHLHQHRMLLGARSLALTLIYLNDRQKRGLGSENGGWKTLLFFFLSFLVSEKGGAHTHTPTTESRHSELSLLIVLSQA